MSTSLLFEPVPEERRLQYQLTLSSPEERDLCDGRGVWKLSLEARRTAAAGAQGPYGAFGAILRHSRHAAGEARRGDRQNRAFRCCLARHGGRGEHSAGAYIGA